MNDTQSKISSILAKALAPAVANALAAEVVAALPQSGVAPDVAGQIIALLGGKLVGAPAPARKAGRPAKAARKAARKAKAAPAAAKPAKVAKAAKKPKLGVSKSSANLVSVRASLRWARHRIAEGKAQPGDEELVAKLEKQLAPKAAKTAPKASARKASARKATANGATSSGIGSALSAALPA